MKKLIFLSFISCCLFACDNENQDQSTELNLVSITSPAADSSSIPFLFSDKNGYTHLSWIERKNKNAFLKFSSFINEKWTTPILIASGNNWFVNWADYPSICSDGKNNLIAHYLEKSDTGTFTYDIKYKVSNDQGKNWSESKILHDDGIKAEHGFVSIKNYGENYFVSWLDGRNTKSGEKHEGHEEHAGQMTLRAAIIDKKGNKLNEWELDDRVCDCCQTNIAITANGPIVVYRDRSAEEIRDMSIVRWENNKWTSPKTIYPDNWKITGCPVNGPQTDAIGNNLAIAWFSMEEKKGEVKVSFSKDGGVNFSDPVRIDEGKPIGRVALKMLNDNSAIVSWMEGSKIKSIIVHADGTKEKPITIAASSEARSSGFPQMSKQGNQIFFAWTNAKEKKINMAKVNLQKFAE